MDMEDGEIKDEEEEISGKTQNGVKRERREKRGIAPPVLKPPAILPPDVPASTHKKAIKRSKEVIKAEGGPPALPPPVAVEEGVTLCRMGCMVSFPACRNAGDVYEPVARIAEGTYGAVYTCRDRKTGQLVAVKKVKLFPKDSFHTVFLREIGILSRFSHPNICGFKEVLVGNKPDEVYIVMEYMQFELRRFMSSMMRRFDHGEVKCLLKQLLKALAVLHKLFVIHRDLKTANLLYSKGRLKLCDFGEARQFSEPAEPLTPVVQSLRYRAPEVLMGFRKYNAAVDMWSCGCIFAELVSMTHLIRSVDEVDHMSRVFQIFGTPTDQNWPGFKDLPHADKFSPKKIVPAGNLRKLFPREPAKAGPREGVFLTGVGFDLLSRMLRYNPSERITAAEALRHPFFQESPVAVRISDMPVNPR